MDSTAIDGDECAEKNQPFGNASRKRLGEFVARKDGRVECDKYDRYGRIVGKVWVKPPDCPTCGKTSSLLRLEVVAR